MTTEITLNYSDEKNEPVCLDIFSRRNMDVSCAQNPDFTFGSITTDCEKNQHFVKRESVDRAHQQIDTKKARVNPG